MLIVKWKTQRTNTAGVRYYSTNTFISSKVVVGNVISLKEWHPER